MQAKKQLAKNTMILAVGKISTQSISFFLLPLYTAVLSREDYGAVDLVTTYAALLMPLILWQIDQALFRFLIDARNMTAEKNKILTTILLFGSVQGVVLTAVFFVVPIFRSSSYHWYILYLLLANVASTIMLQTARGLGDTVGYTIASSISAIVQVMGNLIFLALGLGAEGMLTASILGHIATAVFLFVREQLWHCIDWRLTDAELLRQMLRYSLPLVPNALSWWAITASDRVIVSAALGTAVTGLLSVGHKFSTVYITVYRIFDLAWTESAALHIHAPARERDAYFSEVITDMFRLFMCAAIGIIACMPFVFPCLVNPQFGEAYNLVPFFMLASMFHVVVGLYSVIYVALKKSSQIAKTSAFAGIINIAVHLLLLPSCGMYAAPLSTVAGFGAMAIYRYIDLRKYVQLRLEKRTGAWVAALYLLTVAAYFSENVLLQGGTLVFLTVVSIVWNRKLLLQGWSAVKDKLPGLF